MWHPKRIFICPNWQFYYAKILAKNGLIKATIAIGPIRINLFR